MGEYMNICGIVDLGSNTIRLSVYQWEGRSFQLLLNQKTTAGLAGYVQEGALSEAGILVAARVLTDYQRLLRNFNVGDMGVFATASLRNITNSTQAVEALREATGLTVEVLSGEAEARLSFRGAAAPGGTSEGLLADIGGGSFELVAYEASAITSSCSLPVGSLSLFTQYVSGLFPTADERRAMEVFVEASLADAKTAGLRRTHLCGVGGTIRAVYKLAVDLLGVDPECRHLTAAQVEDLYQLLQRGDRDTLRQILHTVPDRVHTILPGLIILRAIVNAYGVETIVPSPFGVREGYLMERVMGI